MSNLKEIRTRIQSVAATRKITSAMKMVSAAKFHKSLEAITRYKPYAKKAHQILESISRGELPPSTQKWFTGDSVVRRAAIVVISSNSSLCGAFNINIGKKIIEEGPKILPGIWGGSEVVFYTIGRKGNEFIEKQRFSIASNRNDLIEKPDFNATAQFTSQLIDSYLTGQFGEIYVAYNQFRNPAVQVPCIERLLPLTRTSNDSDLVADYIYEPSQQEIAELIIPKIIRIGMYNYILESCAGEHGARMTSMHQATDNATQLINALTLQYNKERQAAITKEILEIVSGAEALKG